MITDLFDILQMNNCLVDIFFLFWLASITVPTLLFVIVSINLHIIQYSTLHKKHNNFNQLGLNPVSSSMPIAK